MVYVIDQIVPIINEHVLINFLIDKDIPNNFSFFLRNTAASYRVSNIVIDKY